MPTYILSIANWVPATDNALARHWTVRRRLKRADADVLKAEMVQQDIPRAIGPRRVTLNVTVSGRRGTPDPSNLWKSLLDGMTKCGLILGDTGALCVLGTPTVCRGSETVTVITLEDLEN